ncbi:carboxylesterase/lipase family protein [Gordonia sp. (in: high G+C Gram-positive bacteria)]|uniref:carboxylesterase/lipase family protein n=1 Tax=Gordonia sp. (in: high G+C Gram-positive bacteria) TaxID=84139 RepID=UPI001697CDEC|nr:carboxylesterase/lipase family protein [Gordonia sp. (in: high G+C Gram-positive bacteria)]NLG47346.1 carboxylesterase/lipase family protein [Gordonia sp. (in: high G+C Gram-positive bacteria)]
MAGMETVVQLADGAVDGKRGRGGRRGTVSWRGIPFAEPPVRQYRWRAPRPVVPWPGVRECYDYGNAPVQDKIFTARGAGKFQPRSEDCLTLNVFAPATTSVTPRPVMVFFYGGAYILGGTSTPIYDGSYLARLRDVIVVTVNYRVGPLGFLDFTDYSTDDRQFDSNLGLRDMVAGLEWVQRNIAEFGGDPKRVTIFGESAGGSAVLTLLSTPAAEGLFSGAISQSPAPDLFVTRENAQLFADEYVRLLKDPTRRKGTERDEPPLDPEEVARIIDGASATELLAAGNKLLGFTRAAKISDAIPFSPVVDGDYLPLSPLDAARVGQTIPVPTIVGNNKDEGELFARFWDILPDSTQALVGIDDKEVIEQLEILYPGKRDDVRLAADATFWTPTILFAGYHSEHAPTYVYRYDYAPALLKASGIGATHATELLALFGIYRDPIGAGIAAAGSWGSSKRISATMQSRWTWFARTGVPAPDWPAYTRDDRRVMILDDPPRVERDPDGARREAWERVHQMVNA